MNGKLGRVRQTKQECAHNKNMFIAGKGSVERGREIKKVGNHYVQ